MPSMDCNEMLRNVMEFSCLVHQMLWNIKAETMECYKMIHKLI